MNRLEDIDMEITTDLYRAKESLKLMDAYFANKNIKNQAQVILPDGVEKYGQQHYCYLFLSCLLNHGMKSSTLHENLQSLYQNKIEVFSPEYVFTSYKDNYSDLADLLRTYIHVRYPNESAKRWIALCENLHINYHDNPKEKFLGKTKYDELKKVICSINGMGQKTGGLLLRILIDNGMVISTDGIREIPIDRHDIDLCVWLGVIKNITSDEIKKDKKIISKLSEVWVQASDDLAISPSVTDQYLWIIGSQLCTNKYCDGCPICAMCFKKGDI